MQYEALAHRITRSYHRRYSHYHSYDDLLQEAKIAIVKAHRTFKASRAAFMTHTYNTIRFALSKFVQKHTGLVHVPYKKLTSGVTPPQCVNIESCKPVGCGIAETGEIEARISLEKVMAGLSEDEQAIMDMVYRDGRSTFEVCRTLGKSRVDVLSIHKVALVKMREACAEFGFTADDLRGDSAE